jgi:hypothetical protein
MSIPTTVTSLGSTPAAPGGVGLIEAGRKTVTAVRVCWNQTIGMPSYRIPHLPDRAGRDALLRLHDRTGPDVLEVLEAAAVQPPEGTEPRIHHLRGNVRGYATITLAAFEERAHSRLSAPCSEGSHSAPVPPPFPTAEAVLQHVFGQPRSAPLPPHEDLTEPQQRAVRTLAEMGEDTCRWGNFMLTLSAWAYSPSRWSSARTRDSTK